MNPLLCVLHPRRIPEVVECLASITNYDRLLISFYPSRIAHGIARDYVIQHKEYTHLVLIADDIVFPSWYVDIMCELIGRHPTIRVLGCPCNVDTSSVGKTLYALSMEVLPGKNRRGREYKWTPKEQAPREGIYPVKHQAAALFFIDRKLLETGILTLQTDEEAAGFHSYNDNVPIWQGCCQDVVISNQLAEAGIPSLVDFSLPIKHLKVPRGQDQGLLVGKRNPIVELVYKVDPQNAGKSNVVCIRTEDIRSIRNY